MPIYGPHRDIHALEDDKGLAVFSRVGCQDAYSFGNVEDKLSCLWEVMGEENVDVRVYDNLPHGFGLGVGTSAEGWIRDAVAFWEKHRSNC